MTVRQINDTVELPRYQYLFILDDFNIDLIDLFNDGNKQSKNYTFMLIIPRQVIADKIESVHSEVGNDIRDVFIIPFALFSIIMMLGISFFLKQISTRITKPIIELFQKIQNIITAHQNEKNEMLKEKQQQNINGMTENTFKTAQAKNQEFNIMLNYKPRNKEINLLYLAFSNLTKTIKVARNSLYEGDDNQALIGYHEVAQIFRQLENQQKLGMCMNNLGCIYLKKDSFDIANEYLQCSIEIQEQEQNKKVNNKDEQTNQFVKACRLYNKGLVNYKYILKLIKEYVPQFSLSSFIKKIPDQNKPLDIDKETNLDTKQQIFI